MRSRGAWMVSLVLTAAPLPRAGAQSWNSSRAMDLVRQATDRRVQQLADSGLLDYRASAHGYVTFLAQLGEGLRTPPRVVKADELALEVYWRAPNLSKQRIVGRRDTTLLPTDIAYHRDHLGIVQNNFPAIIRIGDGDEVHDVPHPLSAEGLRQYEFALSDSLRITIPGRVIDVYELKVRPIDDRQSRFVGAVYVERASAQVVRMAFGFTRAAYIDKQLEDVFVVLENGLVGTRHWLPRRQEIEIRRQVQWMDYPARGIIRGRWDIGDYSLNVETPPGVFIGPEIIEAPRDAQRSYPWASGRIVDSLPPESKLPTPTEILRVQAEARDLVRAQAIEYGRARLAARSASDVLRFDRNSGFSIGSGFGARLTRLATFEARGAYGFGDQRRRGAVSLGIGASDFRASAFVSDDARDAGDVAERSSLVNSLAAQEFGSDFTDRYRVVSLGLAFTAQMGRTDWTLTGALERHDALGVHVSPFRGAFRSAFDAADARIAVTSLQVERSTAPGWFGTEWRATAEARVIGAPPEIPGKVQAPCPLAAPCGVSTPSATRGSITFEVERPFGDARVVGRTFAAAVRGDPDLRAQDLVLLGGPISAPGFAFHELVGDRAVSQSVEFQAPVPFPSLSLGRFGRSSARALLTPHWTVVAVHRVASSTTIHRGTTLVGAVDPLRPRATGVYHSAGIGLVTLFDLVRFDVSREMPSGRWLFSADIARAFWPIL